MRIVFIGCVHSSQTFLTSLLEVKGVEVVGIVTRSASQFNSDFVSLGPIAEKIKTPCFFVDDKNFKDDYVSWVADKKPDIIYCFGWSSLLSDELLSIPPRGCIGYHPAALPQNRGRHPIVWTLALGLSETASTFFSLESEADTGAILSQQTVPVDDKDNAQTLYDKLMSAGREQVKKMTQQLIEGTAQFTRQSNEHTNHWRKRSKKDGEIDWRMSARSIYNLVRALSHPYVGAHFCLEGEDVKVWNVRLSNLGSVNTEPGKILAVREKSVHIKCGEDSIEVLDCGPLLMLKQGEYL